MVSSPVLGGDKGPVFRNRRPVQFFARLPDNSMTSGGNGLARLSVAPGIKKLDTVPRRRPSSPGSTVARLTLMKATLRVPREASSHRSWELPQCSLKSHGSPSARVPRLAPVARDTSDSTTRRLQQSSRRRFNAWVARIVRHKERRWSTFLTHEFSKSSFRSPEGLRGAH
jgi:hypothetical protein